MTPPIYFQVNGKIIFNDILAKYESFVSGNPIEFYCYSDEYDRLDWTTEPKDSFDELMTQHAHYLRAKYDKIILSWSGGTDSQTIYNIFVKNNIHIDEIIAWVNDEYEPWNASSNYNWMLKNHPDPTTKITAKSRFDPEGRKRIVNNEDWLFQNTTMIAKFSMVIFDVSIQDYCDEHYGNGTWCIVNGHEQPNVYLKDGQYYANHLSKTFFSVMGTRNIECFYLDPVLTLKQSFMIKNCLQRLAVIDKYNEGSSDKYKNYFGSRSLGNKSPGTYKAWSKVVGRHDELVFGESWKHKNIEEQFNYAQVNPKNIDGTLTSTVDPGLAALLAKDVDVAKTFERGIKNLLLERDFCAYIMDTSDNPDKSLIGKAAGRPLFSRPHLIG